MERFLKSRYRIGEKLSENPFSITYKGTFLATDKPLVIKIYKRGTLSSNLIRNMKQKVKELSQISYHGIAKLIDGDYGWQGFYYVREFVPGTSLKELLANKEKLGEEKAVLIAEEACRALEFTHERGIVHGALAPSNIIVDKKGVVKLVDFVIEGEIKESYPQKAEVVLSAGKHYMSPEEILGCAATAASDVYALGLILSEMLSQAGELPRCLQEIIQRSLQRDPLLRFSSAKEVRESLEHKSIVLKAPAHADYIKIFENTVTRFGDKDISPDSEEIEDVGRVKLRWHKEKHRHRILLIVLALAMLAGVLYAFTMGR